MSLSIEVVKERLRETFGSDSQETVAKKLNMTQGNVSKLLSGAQQPALDTLYRIAEVYGVSVDWLMGLSDRKKTVRAGEGVPYSLAVEVITELIQHGAKLQDEKGSGPLSLVLGDPILYKLIRKSHTLSKADREIYREWKGARLSMFDDKSLLYESTFREDDVNFLASEAETEVHLLEVYKEGKREQEDYAAMMAENPGPFGD